MKWQTTGFVCLIALISIVDASWNFPCGWPYLVQNSISPPQFAPTKALQRLLNFHGFSCQATGVFDSQTTTALVQFQQKNEINATGHTTTETWLALLIPVGKGKFLKGDDVTAVQELLSAWGFKIEINGTWNGETSRQVQEFKKSRHLSIVDRHVDPATWNDLISGCNSTKHNEFGMDLGWPEGSVDMPTFKCLRNFGFSFVTMEAYTERVGFWEEVVQNAINAKAAGFEQIHFYHFFNQSRDPVAQITETITKLRQNNLEIPRLWFDIEGDWPNSTKKNAEFVNKALDTCISLKVEVGIYCGREWPKIFGDWSRPAKLGVPLWYAHYDQIPSFVDWWGQPYGGWTKPNIKQFWDDGAGLKDPCKSGVDWNYSPGFF